jgi:hypothetical protein
VLVDECTLLPGEGEFAGLGFLVAAGDKLEVGEVVLERVLWSRAKSCRAGRRRSLSSALRETPVRESWKVVPPRVTIRIARKTKPSVIARKARFRLSRSAGRGGTLMVRRRKGARPDEPGAER